MRRGTGGGRVGGRGRVGWRGRLRRLQGGEPAQGGEGVGSGGHRVLTRLRNHMRKRDGIVRQTSGTNRFLHLSGQALLRREQRQALPIRHKFGERALTQAPHRCGIAFGSLFAGLLAGHPQPRAFQYESADATGKCLGAGFDKRGKSHTPPEGIADKQGRGRQTLGEREQSLPHFDQVVGALVRRLSRLSMSHQVKRVHRAVFRKKLRHTVPRLSALGEAVNQQDRGQAGTLRRLGQRAG